MDNENCVFKSQEGSAKRHKTNIDLKQFFSEDQKKMYHKTMYKIYKDLGVTENS